MVRVSFWSFFPKARQTICINLGKLCKNLVSWIEDMHIKPTGSIVDSSYSWMAFGTKKKTWTEVNNRYAISVRIVRLATFQKLPGWLGRFDSVFGYFNGPRIFLWKNYWPLASLRLFIQPPSASIFRVNKHRWSHSCSEVWKTINS